MEIQLLITEFLADKQNLKTSDDELNIVDNQIHTWSFKNIPQPTTEELQALIPVVQAKLDKEALIAQKQLIGAVAREKCQKVLDIVAGFNESNLSSSQIDGMVQAFAPILVQLQMNRPSAALALIQNVTVDGVAVTEEMKSIIVEILSA